MSGSESFKRLYTITKSDTEAIHPRFQALYVAGATGTTCNVTVNDLYGNTAEFKNVLSGTVLPMTCNKVRSTGTTATILIGFTNG